MRTINYRYLIPELTCIYIYIFSFFLPLFVLLWNKGLFPEYCVFYCEIPVPFLWNSCIPKEHLVGESENTGAHDCWDYGLCREELALNGAQDGGGGHILSPSGGARVGGGVGLFSSASPDVQSLWSFHETFNEKESIEWTNFYNRRKGKSVEPRLPCLLSLVGFYCLYRGDKLDCVP